MKIELFADTTELKVGDLVAGPSALVEMPQIVATLPCASEQSMRDECKKRGIPLYEVASIVNRRLLWMKWHYAKLRRISDGEVLKISLDPPAFD